MAFCFELVVNFGENLVAAQAAARTEPWPMVLSAGRHRIPLHRALIRTVDSYVELSLLPVAVGFGVSLDGSIPRFRLTAAELTELGNQLYRLLEKFDGYEAAMVGWDPEPFLDPAELRGDWSEELADGKIRGLVLSDAMHAEFGLDERYVEFQPGYRWIPYQGERRNGLTAD